MATPDIVALNVAAALEACGLVPNPTATEDAEALSEVRAALEDVQGMSWSSGKPENN